MAVVLRAMRPEDVDAVWSLERLLFKEDAWPRLVLEREVKSKLSYYIVLEEARGKTPEIIAYAGLLAVPPSADVQTIGVVPEREGRGYGALMLRQLLGEAWRRGVENVLLEVRDDNARAQRLYRRFGFEVIDVRKHYYSDGFDAKVMKKRLGKGGKTPGLGKGPGVGPVGSEAIRRRGLA